MGLATIDPHSHKVQTCVVEGSERERALDECLGFG